MYYFYGEVLFLGVSPNVREACHIGRDDIFSASVERVSDLSVRHCRCDRLVVKHERVVGAAAHVGLLHLYQLKPLHLRQKLSGLLADAKHTLRTAAVMICHLMWKRGIEAVVMQNIDKEIRQLVDMLAHFLVIVMVRRVKKHLVALVDYVRHTCRGWHNNIIALGYRLDKLVAKLDRIVNEAKVVGKTAATSLIGIVFHVNAGFAQQLIDVHRRLRIELV